MGNAGASKDGTFVETLNPPQIPHLEDYFMHEERGVFFPTTQNLISFDNLTLYLIAFKLLKTDPKLFKEIIVTYLDCCARIVESVEKASHGSHWMGAIVKETTVAAIAHRIGLIDDGGYEKIVDQNRNIFDKLLVKDIALEGLAGVTTLVQGSQTSMGEWSTKGLSDILAAMKGMK
jgi:hypothetical protein